MTDITPAPNPPPETPVDVDPRVPLARERTSMACFRTQLAMDRTTLAWIRTTLAIAGFGFGMVGFFRSLEEKHPTAETTRLHQAAIRFGVALILLGIISMVMASAEHWRTQRRLQRGEAPVLAHWPLSVTVALLLAILGLAGLWALLA